MSRQATDLYRLISMIAVVLIHSTGFFEYMLLGAIRSESPGIIPLLEGGVALFLNQTARFSVPLFLLLSGFALQEKYGEKSLPFREFLTRRSSRVVAPFLFWSLLSIFLLHPNLLGLQGEGGTVDPAGVTYLLLVQGSDYHLYFLIIILQCYLLFPLLRRINGLYFIALLLFVHLLFTSPSHFLFQKMGWYRPEFPSSFVIYWIFYFYAGIELSRRMGSIQNWMERGNLRKRGWFWLVISLLPLAAILLEYIFRIYRGEDPVNYNHFNRHGVVLYTLGVTISMVAFFRDRKEGEGKEWWIRWSGLSFCVYLIHPWILRGMGMVLPFREVILESALLLILSFGAAALLDRMVRTRVVRTILGL